jgi:hypothetical protein
MATEKMTAYRHPFNRKLQPDQFTKPPLATWIKKGLEEYTERTRSQKHTIDYWFQLYKATPAWLSDEQVAEMKALYNSANAQVHEIDHIVPLNNPLVCGLNVPWNLEKICKKLNKQKSNNFWPDAPFEQGCLLGGFDIKPHQTTFV